MQCGKQFTMTPQNFALSNYWSFDFPSDPVSRPDIYFGSPDSWTFTDQKGSSPLYASWSPTDTGPWGDAGPAKIGSGFINNSAGMFFIAPTGAWNSTSGGVSMFGWFRLRPPGPDGDLNLMSATFLYDGNPGVGIGWNVGAGKFQFALGALAAPPSAVTDWFFLAFTFNNITGLQKLYFNGALIGQEINNGFLPGSAPQTQFNVYGGTGVFDGDEFGLSLQSEFSQDHILALYNGGAGKTWPAVDS